MRRALREVPVRVDAVSLHTTLNARSGMLSRSANSPFFGS